MSIIGHTNLTVQLDTFTTEFWWPFLLTNSSVTQCLLGLDFLIENDCVIHAKAGKMYFGQIRKTNELKSTTKNNKVYLVLDEQVCVPARHEKMFRCKDKTEEGELVNNISGIVEGLPQNTCSVRTLNIRKESICAYRNARIS